MPLSAGTRLGCYEILSQIGAGGMAEVYRARDARLGRDVALKVLPSEFAADPDRLRRFELEARAVAGLSHPNVLAVYDVGGEEAIPYLVTELLEGENLRERLKAGGLTVRKAVEAAVQIAQGLAAAHEKGIVHRDLNPANVFVTKDGHVKILDFGLAKLVAPGSVAEPARASTMIETTEAGARVGTVGYTSPEQLRGTNVDHRTDIFSFGCVLYEMLSGRPPFRRATAADTASAILHEDPPALAGTGWDIPPALEGIVRRCLEKIPEDRLSSAHDLALALKAVFGETGAGSGRAVLPSVAILPFVNLSPDPDNDYFADGITEDVIAHLAKVRSLKVISRSSVMGFKKREKGLREIGAALGVGTIVDGSVRRAGDRVRIVAKLIDARTDEHLWVETYDRDLTDIFTIQTDVALKITAALQAELSPNERARIGRPPTADLEAYQLYLQGRQRFTKFTPEGYRQGIALFEQAIAKDPRFALAHTALAYTYAQLGVEGTLGWEPELVYRRAKDAIANALSLDDGLGEAHGIAGLLRYVCDFDWTGAEKELRLALDLSPGSADVHDQFGWLCSSLGRCDEALAAVRRARELDPLAHPSDVASELMRAGRYEEALQEAVRIVQLDPALTRGHSLAGWAHLKLGHVADGLAALERAAALSPEETMFRAQLGQAYAITGDVEKARVVLGELKRLAGERYVSPYHFAYVYTGLGEYDAAIDWLEHAFAQRAGALYGIKGSFLFAELREHPRFVALLRKMNLA
jgi:serine/threonine protein kinase/tetratricopeptide (TPR) repeat protein